MANKTGILEKDNTLLVNGQQVSGGASDAENVAYEGSVNADNVGAAIDTLKGEVDTVAASSGSLTQIQRIKNYIDKSDQDRYGGATAYRSLRFVHLTDTHATYTTSSIYAQELLKAGDNKTRADFMVITGDVISQFGSGYDPGILTPMKALDKPCYICLGNHDVAASIGTVDGKNVQYNSFTNEERWKYFFNGGDPYTEGSAPKEGSLDANNMAKDPGYIPSGKTYYSVNYDFNTAGQRVVTKDGVTKYYNDNGEEVTAASGARLTTSRYKLIFLDIHDGVDRYAGPGGGTTSCVTANDNTVVSVPGAQNGYPSHEQVQWFIDELTNANSTGRCILVFLHTAPGSVTNKVIENWKDYDVSPYNGISVFAEIMQAYLDGTGDAGKDVTFRGTTYHVTFKRPHNTFAGWFCGHTHWDCYGWLNSYPKQPVFCSTRTGQLDCNENVGIFGSVINVKNRYVSAANYVMVEAGPGRVSVVRYGNTMTKTGIKRDAMCINFK